MHQVTLQPSGRRYAVPSGKSILDAGLEAGIALPYSCRAAGCNSCRARITAGEIDHGVVFGTLSKEDQSRGYALMCRARPLSDIVVEVRELEGFEGISSRTLPCRVVSIERAAPDVALLQVRVPNAEGLRFLAGQYADFLTPDGSRRSFSIANKPTHELATGFEFHIRAVPGGGFTTRVFESLKPRDILSMEAPLGGFHLRRDSAKPIVMVASGTGFAPVGAMV
ncbi:MAG: 2Fe-2S iron-sulfur cluster-binding protein, partial [Pseudomonadota bacterium]|nr:2Fe-2S iron-sulfur cluster-binding protein [Pseudomonadota bacterium]